MIISVLGLGYVGLPLALELAKHHTVIAYDISTRKIEDLQRDSPNKNITFTSYPPDLHPATIHIICVPTLLDQDNNPDISALINATETVARNLKIGDIVIYESTLFPGCTEETCLPIIEKISGLKQGQFHLAYSPERINPGDPNHQLSQITKIVSADNPATLDFVAKLYEQIIEAGVHRAKSIKVAEITKLLENTQRAVNIALMNEFSIICDKLDINTSEVIECARTKWNFLNFSPGLVGGNCINLASNYLSYVAKKHTIEAEIINSACSVNSYMPMYIAKTVLDAIQGVYSPRVLILGATYKENVADIRNAPSFDIYYLLNIYCKVEISDYVADKDEVRKLYDVKLTEPSGLYDAIILAVPHTKYTENSSSLQKYLAPGGLFYDLRAVVKI